MAADTAGVVHNVEADDDAAIALARRYLSHFPLNAGPLPPRRDAPDVGPRCVEDLLEVIPPDPGRPYSVHQVLERLVDGGELLEVQPGYGQSVLTGLAHLAGRSVAIVANEPSVMAGAIDSDAADKAAHFLDVAGAGAGAFALPGVFLADNPGLLPAPAPRATASCATLLGCSPCSTGCRCPTSTSRSGRRSASDHQ